MDIGGPAMVVLIILASTIGWLVNNWIRAKHGYPLEDEWGGKTEKPAPREDSALRQQNEELRASLSKMHDRMAVLERIVTDKGYTVAEEIEALRDTPSRSVADNGVPLDIRERERG